MPSSLPAEAKHYYSPSLRLETVTLSPAKPKDLFLLLSIFRACRSSKSAMEDASKHQIPLGGTLKSLELKSFISAIHTRRRIKLFAYGFMIAFIACTVFLAFNPSGSSSPWYNRIFFTSHSSSFFSFFFPQDRTTRSFNAESENLINSSFYAPKKKEDESVPSEVRNVTRSSNATRSEKHLNSHSSANSRTRVLNYTEIGSLVRKKGKVVGLELEKCNVFDGRWVRDDSYPIYREGSCRHIDEPFNCYLNGRSDRVYQKLRWQPNGCNIPRLNGTDMLERLRGKRLVFVGDSLNRNMWESLVCVLGNDVEDKSKVFEASGRREFRSEGSYSFIFKDYNCSVEFFWSPFLVQEWENSEPNGTKKETLRLDVIERSSSKYKNADVIVFNTGHWWTHEKTSKGKDYYQEGRHIYDELNVEEAFRKALTTWARWVDANISPENTLVFFKGYSASHFSGGQWNYGGACDRETEPIKNETYLGSYPPTMSILESVIKGMRTPVTYLNITRMTDYRKDAHPSIYRKQNLTDEERRSPERYQDCSHWCLPGVPDTWNELLYAQLIVKQRH